MSKITCRTCLKENLEDYKHIYDVHESGELIGGILIDCTDLDVSFILLNKIQIEELPIPQISNENDLKPQHICSECFEQLLAWLDFKAMAVKSDQYLAKIAKKSQLSSAKRKAATIVAQPGVKIKKIKARDRSVQSEVEEEKVEVPHVNIRKVKVEQETLDL
jgi:Zinc-finger associated domain (zf-AD)